MKKQSNKGKKNQSSFFKKAKNEVLKSTCFFLAGSITATVLIMRSRRRKKMREKLKAELKEAKQNG